MTAFADSTTVPQAQPFPRIITACVSCGSSDLSRICELPKLPFTALFSAERGVMGTRVHDQAFLFCTACGHGMLERQLAPAMLYGAEYGFRTAESVFGKSGTDRFLSFVRRVWDGGANARIVDIGCNDLSILQAFDAPGRQLLGIDPIWEGREQEVDRRHIRVIGSFFETVDMAGALGGAPDVVLCRHTLEHVDDPRLFLEKMLAAGSDDTLFIFEFPHLDTLVARYRFDHIFHQHVQYFSKHSFLRLIDSLGATAVAEEENPFHWEAYLVAFRKRTSAVGSRALPAAPRQSDIEVRLRRFQEKMRLLREVLRDIHTRPLVGFGAAQMLPVLVYHLGNQLFGMETVYDDDPARAGLSYVNLPVRIERLSEGASLNQTAVFLTAPDSARAILPRLRTLGAKEIYLPTLLV